MTNQHDTETMPEAGPAAEFEDTPWIISVDDHVTEPADLWTSRLPSRFVDRAPHVVRERVTLHLENGEFSFDRNVPDGDWSDVWVYENATNPMNLISNAVGHDDVPNIPMTFDSIAPGCWKQKDRLEDMTRNRMEASLGFPNSITRFCGQTFLEADDKELGLACVQAYNDWMIDEWCAGDGYGRLIPVTLIPLWDPHLAAAEIRRCADKGAHAVSFCENPYELGLPSVHDDRRWWDPFFQACADVDTTICMHIGSSSKMPLTSPDAPHAITSILLFENSMTSMLDVVMSGLFERFPKLRVAYSEGQIGWLPYAIRRADRVWAHVHEGGRALDLPHPPSSYIPGHVYGCIFDDDTALACRDLIGMDQIMCEVDYPHAAATYPHTTKFLTELCDWAGLDQSERYKLFRGNAITAFGLQRFGITA